MPDYSCPDCQDRGIILNDDGTARICPCQEQKRLEKLFKSSQITPAFRCKTFENFVVGDRPEVIKAMYDCAKDYADNFEKLRRQENNWLVLLGQPGCGKTHLSIAVANVLLARKIPVLYFQHVEGMSELKDSLRGDEGIRTRLEDMKRAELLIWDDLFKGKRQPRDFEIEIAFEVLNYRYLNLLPTIISSEKTVDELVQIDEAIGSRIIERGKEYIVEVRDGKKANYRLTKGE